MACGEKAILDALYLRSRRPVANELEFSGIDVDLPSDVGAKFPLTVRRAASDLSGRLRA